MTDAIPNLRSVSSKRGTISSKHTSESDEALWMADYDPVRESMGRFLQDDRHALEFCLNEATGRVLIRVMDGERRSVIRKIGFDQALRLLADF
ncbi:flagellar protein FlaG [Thiorhodococcus fuscus]|uniref:Flagellar protein FlaG n=1 Tax=Thiorhodococcus fuscus TaxID=527200 RepID=A0ABW4Y5M5_9GAMM